MARWKKIKLSEKVHNFFFKEFFEISIFECLIASKERNHGGLRMKQIFDHKIFMI